MLVGGIEFREVVLADFEFTAAPGERPAPICVVAHELVSGRVHRLFTEELRRTNVAPYPTGRDTLFVAYYASAELGCHLALGWPLPERVLDLYVEFRNRTNGLWLPYAASLLGALQHFGLDGVAAVEKESMRELAMRGGPYKSDEARELLAYCESDVVALKGLFQRMGDSLDVHRAILRGRYMAAAARIESVGIPVDVKALTALRERWNGIQGALIARIDASYGVFEGRTFKSDRFAKFLCRADIPWPRLDSGELALDDDTFREMARIYPVIGPLRELRYSLSQMRLAELGVGRDGRNRALLSAFRARTGRNQPSNSKFIFGPAVWLRGLIRPVEENGLAYIDWSQQEFGIAAALSRDPAMMAAYESGDPYLAFAKQAGAAPVDATKKSHGAVRDLFKACVLGVQYAMGAESLSRRINKSEAHARELLRMHRETYPVFWRWSDAAVNHAMMFGRLHTVFGWQIRVDTDANPRSLRNFPMQANGAEMLRLACCLGAERGVRICAPVHDAVLVEAPLQDLQRTVATMQTAMSDASAVVLDGFRLRSDAKIIRHPDRYEDERGRQMWEEVWAVMRGLEGGQFA